MNRGYLIAGIILGAGLGGFVDGIVLHQILQWHHLVCVTEHCQPQSIEHLKQQNRQDGFFHLAVLILTAIGSYRLFRSAGQPGTPITGRGYLGPVLMGWGIFNFVEGIIDHQVLGIQHVLPGSPYQFAADMAFLASGVVFTLIGYWMARSASASLRA